MPRNSRCAARRRQFRRLVRLVGNRPTSQEADSATRVDIRGIQFSGGDGLTRGRGRSIPTQYGGTLQCNGDSCPGSVVRCWCSSSRGPPAVPHTMAVITKARVAGAPQSRRQLSLPSLLLGRSRSSAASGGRTCPRVSAGDGEYRRICRNHFSWRLRTSEGIARRDFLTPNSHEFAGCSVERKGI